ncbi:iron-containing alcohol dehydrogenase family protein [Heliophilum fasciatum]|uniref:Alcohol dehydrogenase class IV n=1 Tax=Heliophilum fasciatum TaxID=35700 RepID=A0A4R2RVS8_9FIRM|nr:iron-containing alcohol dehydrogenase family protein [Heliophilum fasciatum]MCW2276942.1 alcohol dehydrogenase class IV [Heliophilum fasciatum]TCP68532.1 alcohol dehydrogenase class IV [Heliophilum fasciatum]
MNFRFFMPTKIYFGAECVRKHSDEFARWGKRALVVTGRASARVSGALPDVEQALAERGIAWTVYDCIEENPTVAVVEAGGEAARQWQPDLIIAIGGGSPLDAAKAIAALAVNPISGYQLFDGTFDVAPLPVLAIPTTAGTGSEVTPYSILTDPGQQTKKSFADEGVFPKVAFLDARYTASQSRELTIHTAIDALSHAVEGYLSRRAMPVSDSLALEAMAYVAKAAKALETGTLTLADREALLYASTLAGMVIAQTGTTAVHALGYSLTYFHNVPHGRANGLLLGEYLRFNEAVAAEKIGRVLSLLGRDGIDDFQAWMGRLLANDERYSEAEIRWFAEKASQAKSTVQTPRLPNVGDLERILRDSLTVI